MDWAGGCDNLVKNRSRTLARVRHPNVVTVYGAGEHDGQVGLWMELIRGVTLEHMLDAHGPFSAGEAGLIGQDLCRALAAVHRAGLVHGDVRARNVMREQGGRLVLMDCGADWSRSSPGPAHPTFGSALPYLGPELLEGTDGTIRSDLYSLGVLLYHLVTNDFPVHAKTLGDLRAALARGEHARLQDLRPDLQGHFVRVVERAIERDPARRFTSAGEMEAALAQSIGSTANESSPPDIPLVDDRRATAAVGEAPPIFPKPGETLGHYQILEQIGAGGTGVVYRATDKRLKREVAIKVLLETFAANPDRLALFKQEAQAIAALSHPNILTLHDVGTERGLWYAVTELLHGKTLRARMIHGPLPMEEAIEYAIEVVQGLAAAHAKDIVHMDLKPENLMIIDDGWLKILDFGVARVGRSTPPRDDAATQTHHPERGWGTLAYMSPEQITEDHIDHRSDLFSLGTILYEMLAGRHPFQRGSPAATMGAILRDDPEPIASIPSGLDRIVRRSLRKSPAERFQSAREISPRTRRISRVGITGTSGPKTGSE